MTADNLNVMLEDMLKETAKGKLKWRIEIATSEYRKPEDKPTVEADGKTWVVDECYTAYSCEFRGEDFCMISYENIETSDDDTRTINLVFLPPIAMRIFRLNELAPYAVESSAVLISKVHTLWDTLLTMYRADRKSVQIDVNEIQVSDDNENVE